MSDFDAALTLLDEVDAHIHALVPFWNSLGATFGWSSPVGRLTDHRRIDFGGVRMYLDDVLWADAEGHPDRLQALERRRTHPPGPSPAAVAMIRDQHARTTSRRLAPMPDHTETACLAYIDEGLALLERAGPLTARYSGAAKAIKRVRDGLTKINAAVSSRMVDRMFPEP